MTQLGLLKNDARMLELCLNWYHGVASSRCHSLYDTLVCALVGALGSLGVLQGVASLKLTPQGLPIPWRQPPGAVRWPAAAAEGAARPPETQLWSFLTSAHLAGKLDICLHLRETKVSAGR
jgi:hypothetical protein